MALFEALGLLPEGAERPEIAQAATAALAALGTVEFEKFCLEGQIWSLEQAIEQALSDD